jgi:hypothetical protein
VVGTVESDAATIVEVWSRNFELLRGEAARQKVDHSYLSNPVGSGAAFLLRDCQSQTIVGVQCLVLRRFNYCGRVLHAGVAADYSVDPAHRSVLPALMLMKASIAKSPDMADFLYGLPNGKSEAVTKRAGFAQVLQLTRYAAPLRVARYLSPRMPRPVGWLLELVGDAALTVFDNLRVYRRGRRLRWVEGRDQPDKIDQIWNAAKAQGFLISQRDSHQLWWRFRLSTSQPSEWLIDIAEHPSAQPLGYVVWAKRDNIAVIGDFLCADPKADTDYLLEAFRCHARGLGMTAISLEYGGAPSVIEALSRARFARREGNNLYAIRTESLPAWDHWYMTGMDRDTD